MIAWLRKHHWLHDWTNWTTVTATFTSVFERRGYGKVIQIRECKVCDLMQRKDF